MKPPNPYASFGLDRMAERRNDEEWLDAMFRAETTIMWPLWRAKNFVLPGDQPRAVTLSPPEAIALVDAGAEWLFLGIMDGIANFLIDVSHIDEPAGSSILGGRGEFVELRSVSSSLSREISGMLAYGKAITYWHSRHRFCGICGAPTEMREAGHLRVCQNQDCGASHFPRTDPAVIMLVSSGDKVVLGRKAEWVQGMYSTLAGFVEPGESLEEAVSREVEEEVGIKIANIRYHSSQPWPFPASLMLGFYADALSEDITPNLDELEDARWFTRDELARGGAGIAERPRSDSIARRLIAEWIEQG
jgi:NAD+ diphosphatase